MPMFSTTTAASSVVAGRVLLISHRSHAITPISRIKPPLPLVTMDSKSPSALDLRLEVVLI
ncbi:hypothetical protein MVEG_06975 [Podila verticillata NRRL 6337]|nr:hypothetical protein MVEG_06975 [Podila verticillata NRRL 6337]